MPDVQDWIKRSRRLLEELEAITPLLDAAIERLRARSTSEDIVAHHAAARKLWETPPSPLQRGLVDQANMLTNILRGLISELLLTSHSGQDEDQQRATVKTQATIGNRVMTVIGLLQSLMGAELVTEPSATIMTQAARDRFLKIIATVPEMLDNREYAEIFMRYCKVRAEFEETRIFKSAEGKKWELYT